MIIHVMYIEAWRTFDTVFMARVYEHVMHKFFVKKAEIRE